MIEMLLSGRIMIKQLVVEVCAKVEEKKLTKKMQSLETCMPHMQKRYKII